MSAEVTKVYTTGSTVDGYVFRASDNKVWYPVGETWETWGTGSRTAADYASVTMAEQASGSGFFVGDFPTDITTEGDYVVQLRERAGANPANGDTVLSSVDIEWTGTAATTAETVSATATDLCNLSLALIGGAGSSSGKYRISSIYDGSNTAGLCLIHYPQARKETQCRAWWSEATKYADLGAEVSGVTKADWEYAFNLPSDYLGRCQQVHESYHRSTKPRYITQYDCEVVAGRLFTNMYSNEDDDSAYIRYIWNLTDTSKFSPLLYKAVATNLAAILSGPITGDLGRRRLELLQEYEELILPLAEGENVSQGGDDEDLGEYTALTCRTE